MLTVLLLLAQDLTGPPGDEPAAPRTTLTRRRAAQCRPDADADILVCGSGLESQRVEALPEWPSEPVFRPAARRLSPNKSVSVHAEEGSNPFSDGPRAMISFKLDF
ncbi:hypothetical protein OF829_07745 [Sphingomonas sp. LB-2]|uniref:hypothetical protein n=1 Tax=Sphingomonas caeni TaxID=2984949 RepID=UPI00222F16CD|nr:hypothetical protein [Sphingomonas caeni]MCW3847129.1 hypothetical protein [Sphingomonas caeni]